MVLSQTDFKKAKSEKHNVPNRIMMKLGELLADPVLSFELGDSIGFLTKEIDGDGKPLLIGVQKNVDLDSETVNRIKSAYGLDAPQAWIRNQIKEGKQIRIFDKERADSFLDGFGYKAERPENYRSGDIVTVRDKNVKGLELTKHGEKGKTSSFADDNPIQRAFEKGLRGETEERYSADDDEPQSAREYAQRQRETQRENPKRPECGADRRGRGCVDPDGRNSREDIVSVSGRAYNGRYRI